METLSNFEDKFCRKGTRPENTFGKRVHSYGEELMGLYLDILYPGEEYINNFRPPFLMNPRTLHNLEYDRYYPKSKRAYEFNGAGHYSGKNNDRLKKELSKKAGVHLVTINPLELKFRLAKLKGFPLLKEKVAVYCRTQVRTVRRTVKGDARRLRRKKLTHIKNQDKLVSFRGKKISRNHLRQIHLLNRKNQNLKKLTPFG